MLGGGGSPASPGSSGSWEGLADAGVDITGGDTVSVRRPDRSWGTGHRCAVDRRASTPPARSARPRDRARVGRATMFRLVPPMLVPGSEERKLRRIGRMSMRAHPPGGAERIEVIRSRLGDVPWPDRDLRITAFEAETGRFVTFDRSSGVELVLAVAASCAVPLVWPAVAVDGRHYLDGGMRSTANVDLASAPKWSSCSPPSRRHSAGRRRSRPSSPAPARERRWSSPRRAGAGRHRPQRAGPGQAGQRRAHRPAAGSRPGRGRTACLAVLNGQDSRDSP